MWTRRKILRFGLLAPIVALLLVIAGWAIDTGSSTGQVRRNVRLAGLDISGLGSDDLSDRIDQVSADFADTPVEIRTPESVYDTTAEDIGLRIDTRATARAALDEGRTAFLPVRPFGWLLSFVRHHDARLHFQVDVAQARTTLRQLEGSAQVSPVEPTIESTDGAPFEAVPGEPGTGLDPDTVADALLARVSHDPEAERIIVDVEPGEVPPRLDLDVAEAAATVANGLTDQSITVDVGVSATTFQPEQLRRLATVIETEDSISIGLDADRTLDALNTRFADLNVEPQDATITIEGGQPVLTPSVTGISCCTADHVEELELAMLQGRDTVSVGLPEVQPELTTEEAEALGIVEEIGSPTAFGPTTEHACCEARVTNIHRIADIVRGVIIAPGERFSVNDYVGRRTAENGFVPAGVIYDGEFNEDVGGGVSQFATGLFNAALYAGLDIPTYQSHSIYISRYPRGHEATINFPSVDLVIENTTDYGVLIWPTYTDTSLTVHLYGTDEVDVTLGEPTSSPAGNCTRWTTPRTRTLADGTVREDTVHATYRPGEGIDC